MQIGQTITARLYNSVEGRSYGPHFKADIVMIDINGTHPDNPHTHGDSPYCVISHDNGGLIWLNRFEIKAPRSNAPAPQQRIA